MTRFAIALEAGLILAAGSMQPGLAASEPRLMQIEQRVERDIPEYTAEAAAAIESVAGFFADRVDSAWIRQEQDTARQLLIESGPWDVLVAPFSVVGHGFDRVERSLLARMIAARVEQSSNLRVADPGLIAQALGMRKRRWSDDEILSLAKEIGAASVVTGTLGHDLHGHFHQTTTLYQLSGEHDPVKPMPHVISAREFAFPESQAFDALRMPSVALRSRLDEIVRPIIGKGPARQRRLRVADVDLPVPATMDELLELAGRSVLHEAMYLEFLAELMPDIHSPRRQHLLERALVALNAVDPESTHAPLLRARALAGLHRRPAALATLAAPQNPAEQALQAWLDGDLTRLRAAVPRVKEPLLRLLAELDLEETRSEYGFKANEKYGVELAEAHGDWGLPLYRRFTKGSLWAKYSNVWTKLALEALVPVEGVSIDSRLRAAEIAGKPLSEFDVAKMVFSHVSEAVEADGATWLSERPSSTAPTRLDVLMLAIETTEENVMADMAVDMFARGDPEAAVKTAQTYEPVFSGNPDFVTQYAGALSRLVDKTAGPEAAAYERQMYSKIRESFAMRGELIEALSIVAYVPSQFFPETANWNQSQLIATFYRSDFPQRVYATVGGRVGSMAHEILQCLDNERLRVSCLAEYEERLLDRNLFSSEDSYMQARRRFSDYLSRRFVGAPGHLRLKAAAAAYLDRANGRERVYREAIDNGSTDWMAYDEIGTRLANAGRGEDAAEVFLSFPGFAASDDFENITLGNYAFDAGSKLFWAGEIDGAEQLYSIAAADGSGSNANMSSMIRLLLINSELELATELTAARARRYESEYAYRDLVAMLHALGEHTDAWALFDSVSARQFKPQLWTGAMAGHRAEDFSLADVAAWLRTGNRTGMQAEEVNLAERYLFVMGTLDRAVTPELETLLQRLATFEKPRAERGWLYGRTKTVGPDPAYKHMHPDAELVMPTESRLVLAARAMRNLQTRNFAAARGDFEHLMQSYRLNEFAPYMAWASIKSGDTGTIRYWLDDHDRRFKIDNTAQCNHCRYVPQLVAALVEGAEGKHERALDLLRRALADRPYTESRAVFTYYQVLEAAELLYAESGEERYRDFVLDKARRFTVIQPVYAWAYAMVARYTTDSSERREFLATALHLDPQSWRALQLDSQEREQALQWLAENGPRYMMDGSSGSFVKL